MSNGLSNEELLQRVLDKLDKHDDKLDKIAENQATYNSKVNSVQSELSEHKKGHDKPLEDHKKGHKWWVMATIGIGGVIMAIINFFLGK